MRNYVPFKGIQVGTNPLREDTWLIDVYYPKLIINVCITVHNAVHRKEHKHGDDWSIT